MYSADMQWVTEMLTCLQAHKAAAEAEAASARDEKAKAKVSALLVAALSVFTVLLTIIT